VFERYTVDAGDVEAYARRCQAGPCFICEIVAGNPDYEHHMVYEDEATVAFLNKYPTLYGYTLVAPREHAEAVRQEVAAERVYILTLGSQQGNSHVHWHIAPLPPGVPYREQQLAALSWERGILRLSEEEKASLAARVRRRIA
jgi:diadenosine tetraphosphate (Ap4A) HIT family hydrolase